MNRNRRSNRWIWLTLVAASAVTASACSSSGGNLPGAASQPTSPVASTGSAQPKALTLKAASTYTSAPPQSLIDEAKKEGTLIWYDSTPSDTAGSVLAAFQKAYPFVKNVKHIQLRTGDAETRVVQESAAGVQTADVLYTNITSIVDGQSKGFLRKVDWQSIGVPVELTPTPYAVAVTAAVTCLVYNTKLVSAANAPATWQDLISPQFSGGKIGLWTNPDELLPLIQAWGEPKANAYFEQLFNEQPKQYATGSAAVVQAVESGEIPVGISATNVVEPEVAKGAPIKMVIPSPVPVEQLFDSVTTAGKDPAVGELFVSWLTTKAGAAAYAAANSRTSPFLPGTSAGTELAGKELVGFVPSEAATLSSYEQMFTKELGSK